MKSYLFLALLLIFDCCKSQTKDWNGGEITDFGTYHADSLRIRVSDQDYFLKYEVEDRDGNVVIRNDQNISVVHHWGLFLDEKRNLWVFSSDVGDAVWIRDTLTGMYRKKTFQHWLTKDSVPDEVYSSSMKRFIKNH